jgi:hypothetical protein
MREVQLIGVSSGSAGDERYNFTMAHQEAET